MSGRDCLPMITNSTLPSAEQRKDSISIRCRYDDGPGVPNIKEDLRLGKRFGHLTSPSLSPENINGVGFLGILLQASTTLSMSNPSPYASASQINSRSFFKLLTRNVEFPDEKRLDVL